MSMERRIMVEEIHSEQIRSTTIHTDALWKSDMLLHCSCSCGCRCSCSCGYFSIASFKPRTKPKYRPYHVTITSFLLVLLLRLRDRRACTVYVQADSSAGPSSVLHKSAMFVSDWANRLTQQTPQQPKRRPIQNEQTRVSGYGSKRHLLPGCVSEVTTISTTRDTVTQETTRRMVERRIVVPETNDSCGAPIYIQLCSRNHTTNDSHNLLTFNSCSKIRIHSEQSNATITLQSEHSKWKGLDNVITTPLQHHVNVQFDSMTVFDQSVQSNNQSLWIPMQGFFGAYTIPSGHLTVWIVASEPVYHAPALSSCNNIDNSNNNINTDADWWCLHRVTELYLVQVQNTKGVTLTRLQQQEEDRQMALLRQALKQHHWYFRTGKLPCPDMTRNLQQCLIYQQQSQQQKENYNDQNTMEKGNNATAEILRGGAKAEFKTLKGRSWWDYIGKEESHLDRILKNDYNSTSSMYLDKNKGTNEILALNDEKESSGVFATKENSNIIPNTNNATEATDSVDTTNRIQRQRWWETINAQDVNFETGECPPDSRFFWNEAALLQFVELYQLLQQQQSRRETTSAVTILLGHSIPLTSAFCGVQQNLTVVSDASVRYDQILITRRSRFRAGTRYTKRGADATGAVANYAESEQLLFLWQPSRLNASLNDSRVLQSVSSYVQTRGSIPLRWSSPTDIKTYRPRIRIGVDPLAQARAIRHHLVDQASRYTILPASTKSTPATNPIFILLNLIDKHSDQGRLGRALDAVLSAVLDVYDKFPDSSLPWLSSHFIQHLWFDFHAHVKSGRWENLADLLQQVKPALDEHGFCRVTPIQSGGATLLRLDRIQKGIIRTNCMDCLDRTNVVQSLFGRYLLVQQLSTDRKTGLSKYQQKTFCSAPMTLPWQMGELAHRLLWADNADAISWLYAGTPALKGDFTRTGKRTKKGALDDGMNSLQRYYLNNFLDADRQEGVDLLTGYKQFNTDVGDSCDYVAEMDYKDISKSRDHLEYGISVKEAARRLLPGSGFDCGSSLVDDDSNHVRIKVKGRQETWNESRLIANARTGQPRTIDLRWLPGDLQTQVRSLTLKKLGSSRLARRTAFKAGEMLYALDERSASDVPWWVTTDTSSSDSDHTEHRKDNTPEPTTNNPGFVLGALVVGTQRPLTMAAAVVGLIAIAILR